MSETMSETMSERPFLALELVLTIAPHYVGVSADAFARAWAELEAARELLSEATIANGFHPSPHLQKAIAACQPNGAHQ